MPPIKYYEIEQTRRVKVEANSAVEATLIADTAFRLPMDEGIVFPGELKGRVLGNIEVMSINVTKEY